MYLADQKGNLMASRRLEWWLPKYEVDQGNVIASGRLEWWLPQYEVDQGNLIASGRPEWWLPQYEVNQGNLVASRRQPKPTEVGHAGDTRSRNPPKCYLRNS